MLVRIKADNAAHHRPEQDCCLVPDQDLGSLLALDLPKPFPLFLTAVWLLMLSLLRMRRMLCTLTQALTTSVAVWYGVETFRLRSKDDDLPDHTAPGMLAPPPGQQDFGIPPLQQPFTTFSQQFGEYPLEPMAAPDTSGYMSGGPQGAVPVTGPYLPPAREQLYPWGPAQQATFVQTEAGPIASEAEGFGRWGTPQQPLNLADPSTLPSSHFNQTAYEQPAYDAAPGVYGQGSAPAASDFYSQQQQQQQETLYGTHPTESWLPSQQPLTAEASDAPQQLLQQQQWFGAADARPGFAQGPPLEGHHQAHAPASHGAFSVGSNPLDSSLVTGTAASPTAAAMKQPAVSSEPIDDWE